MCLRFLYITDILWNYIQDILVSLCLYNNNYIIMLGKVVCLVYLAAILVGCLGGSVLKVYLDGVVKKKGRLQVLYLK